MTEWIDFGVYATLIMALWFLLPAWSARFTLPFVADRNPEWLAQHPEVAARLTNSTWHRWVYHGWGIVSLAVLLAFQLGLAPRVFGPDTAGSPKWEVLKDLNSLLLLPGIFLFVGAGIVFTRWMQRTVPLAARRQATLERRSIADYISRWIRAAIYCFVSAVLLGWLTAGALQWQSTPKFWVRFVFLLALTAIFEFFVRLSVDRPPHALDRIFGPRFRASEVRIAFAMLVLPPLIGIVRLYEEVTGTVLMDLNRAMHLGVALIVTAWALRFATYYAKHGRDGDSPASSTSTSSPILVR